MLTLMKLFNWGIICNISERIIFQEIFEESPLKEVIKHLFNLQLKYETVDPIYLCKNSLYGQPIRKDIKKEYIIRSKISLVKNNDERVVDNEALSKGEHVTKY